MGSLCVWPLKLALFSLPVPYLPLGLALTLFGDLRFLCWCCVTSGLPSKSQLGQLQPFQEFRVCLLGWVGTALQTGHCWVCQHRLLLSLVSVGAALMCVTTAKSFPMGSWKYCCAYQACFKAGVLGGKSILL